MFTQWLRLQNQLHHQMVRNRSLQRGFYKQKINRFCIEIVVTSKVLSL